MQKLLDYLNGIAPLQREAFAARSNTTVGYLRKACSVGQTLGAELCVSIERATNGAVTRQDLRPDDWREIWPELVGRKAA